MNSRSVTEVLGISDTDAVTNALRPYQLLFFCSIHTEAKPKIYISPDSLSLLYMHMLS